MDCENMRITPIIDISGRNNDIITLKEFKKKIKDLGYKYKTHVSPFGTHRHLEILDRNKNFVCGSGANVYTSETMKKHRRAFELLREYKD